MNLRLRRAEYKSGASGTMEDRLEDEVRRGMGTNEDERIFASEAPRRTEGPCLRPLTNTRDRSFRFR